MQRLSTTEIDKAFRESGLNDKQINEASTSFLSTYGNYPTKEALESFIEGYLFNLRMMRMISDNATVEAEATKDQDTNSNEGWCEIVSHEDLLTSKYFNSYAIGVATGNFNQEKQDFRSYVYKEALDDRITKFLEEAKTEFPDGKIPAVKTVKNHIAELVKCKIPLEMIKIEPTANGVVYKLRNRVDNHWYVQLPYRQIRELVVATNRNMLKLFVVLKYTCNKDCKTFTTIDRGYLAREIGLSDKSTRGKDDISTMLIALAKLGYIEIRQETRTDYDEKAGREIGKKVNSYRLRSLEEYDNINLIARGRKPKK